MQNFEERNKRKESSYTSTGEKILHHQEAINNLRSRRNYPIVMHIMPTEKCNLKCIFCSVENRGNAGKIFPDLSLDQIKFAVTSFKAMGLKAVILSGGGEPAMYSLINELLEYLYSENLEIGMISNGVQLDAKIKAKNLQSLTWLRISINSLDYLEDIDIPALNPNQTTIGFSYIWNPLTSMRTLERIKEKIKTISGNNQVTYVRLLPDCNLVTEDLEKAHQMLRVVAERLGEPFFHQYKIHQIPEECHLGRVHPVLYVDGYLYPCDSLVLNSPPENKKFHPDYALCRWNEINNFYAQPIEKSLVDTQKCPHCVFYRQNVLLSKIINSSDRLPAPTVGLEHLNFI